VTYHESVR